MLQAHVLDLWCRWHDTLHVDDILVNDPSYYATLPQLWDFSTAKFTLRNLTAEFPALSVYAGDVVYLLMKVKDFDTEAWVVGVELRKKTVEALELYYGGRSNPLACAFSGYLNTAPRSCAAEDDCSQNFPLNHYPWPGNITQNNLGNMQIAGEHGNDGQQLPIAVNSYLFHPQLVVPPHCFTQTRQLNFTPSGPGYVGQLPLLTPMDNRSRPQMPGESAPPAVLFNTPMPQVPMDDRFLSQMPPVPASLAVPFNTLMPQLRMDDRFMSQMPVFPVVPFNTLPLVPMGWMTASCHRCLRCLLTRLFIIVDHKTLSHGCIVAN